jgi:hypothetical protein
VTGLGAKTAEDDFVVVFDEAALLAARQRDRFATARGEFEQAPPARFLRRLQPLLVWCATICATVQYIRANDVCVIRCGAVLARRIASVAM